MDRLFEDAEKKKVMYDEACAKVTSQKEELDAARVQVQLPTPPPTLPSDDGDWDQGEESYVDGSEDEARRDVEAGLGMDIDGSTPKRGRTRGRSRSPAVPPVRASGRGRSRPLTPPQPSPPSPSEWDLLGPPQLTSLIQHANERAEEMRQQMGEENWVRVTSVPPCTE